MKKLVAAFVVISLLGCATSRPDPAADALVVSPDQLQRRQLETRKYTGVKEADLLAASANLLQDMGFNLEESETNLGLITAGKTRGGAGMGEIIGKAILWSFGIPIPFDVDQKIRVSLVIRPNPQAKAADEFFVRVTFQRAVRNSFEHVSRETLKEPELYQKFFERLSKAVFIEGQTI
ncbi:MAG TPA: hypothetical protein VEG37_10330 [Burkholderiales bacterium]|nr:hypothetical protein [Burkholderiales bacterium]